MTDNYHDLCCGSITCCNSPNDSIGYNILKKFFDIATATPASDIPAYPYWIEWKWSQHSWNIIQFQNYIII